MTLSCTFIYVIRLTTIWPNRWWRNIKIAGKGDSYPTTWNTAISKYIMINIKTTGKWNYSLNPKAGTVYQNTDAVFRHKVTANNIFLFNRKWLMHIAIASPKDNLENNLQQAASFWTSVLCIRLSPLKNITSVCHISPAFFGKIFRLAVRWFVVHGISVDINIPVIVAIIMVKNTQMLLRKCKNHMHEKWTYCSIPSESWHQLGIYDWRCRKNRLGDHMKYHM